MASNYKSALNRIVTALRAQLAEADSKRLVTRSYKDFADIPEPDLKRGVYTITTRGVDGYDYEASDNPIGLDGPRQTDLGKLVITIVGQGKLPEKSSGEAIDDAEFAMLAELETFADSGITTDDLRDLILRRTVMSQQLEAPYYWVFTEWHLRLFD